MSNPLNPFNPLANSCYPICYCSYIKSMKNKRLLRLLLPILAIAVFVLVSRSAVQYFSKKVSPDASKEECLRTASEYLRKSQPESAIYPLLLAIQKDPDDAQAHFLLAQTYYQTQVFALARKECETTLALDAQDETALNLLTRIRYEEAKINWDKGDLRDAISEFIYILNNTQDQKLIDSIANMSGGRYKIKRLTNDLFFEDAPSFSHDGNRIIYHSDTTWSLEDYGLKKREMKKSRIFMMDKDGGNKTCLSSAEGDDSSERFARFSGDGKKIVYEKENQYPEQKDTIFNLDRDIFIKNMDTGEVRRVTDNHTYDGLASFSPDDKRILFVCDRPGARSSLYILDLDTGEGKSLSFKKPLTERITRKPGRLILPYCPSFSPDGEKILFHGGYKTRKIYLVDENGKTLKCLTKGQTDDFFPAFSPDGKRIVFVSGQQDQEDLFVVNSDGSDRTRLTFDGGKKKYPSFSPDANLIVFAAKQKDQDDRYYEIYALNLRETIPKEKLVERLEEMLKTVS
jgi:Tol biopolymer transport system component